MGEGKGGEGGCKYQPKLNQNQRKRGEGRGVQVRDWVFDYRQEKRRHGQQTRE